jgi:hypothetical protein
MGGVERVQYGLHTRDFGPLSGIGIGSETEEVRLLSPAGRREQIGHHGEGALVVLDHETHRASNAHVAWIVESPVLWHACRELVRLQKYIWVPDHIHACAFSVRD